MQPAWSGLAWSTVVEVATDFVCARVGVTQSSMKSLLMENKMGAIMLLSLLRVATHEYCSIIPTSETYAIEAV